MGEGSFVLDFVFARGMLEGDPEGVQGLTDWGANLVIGALFRIGPAFRVRLEVEDYMYETEFTFSTGEKSRPRFQNDFVFTIGLSIPIG